MKMFPYLAPTPQGLGEQGDCARAKVDRVRLTSSLEREKIITVLYFQGSVSPMVCAVQS